MDTDHAVAAAVEGAELYYAAHPGSPSAVRRPKLAVRSGTWIALLGRDVQDGIVGSDQQLKQRFALLMFII